MENENENATWERNGKIVTGRWEYYRPSDKFIIHLDKAVPYGGQKLKKIILLGEDTPEFNGFKLVRGE